MSGNVRLQGGLPERGPGGTVGNQQIVTDTLPVFLTVSTSSDFRVGVDKRFVLGDASSQSIRIVLPPANTQNLPISVKKTDNSANTVTILPSGGLIDGATSYVLANHNDAVMLMPHGSNWYASSIPLSAGSAPADATYITQIPNPTLTAEQALSLLATGILKSTTVTGVVSIAAHPADYLASTDTVNHDLSGTYDTPTVSKIDGVTVDNHTTPPTNLQVLTYVAADTAYEPRTVTALPAGCENAFTTYQGGNWIAAKFTADSSGNIITDVTGNPVMVPC